MDGEPNPETKVGDILTLADDDTLLLEWRGLDVKVIDIHPRSEVCDILEYKVELPIKWEYAGAGTNIVLSLRAHQFGKGKVERKS